MDQDLYDKGMKIRRQVLGDQYVDNALSKAGPFNDPLQELVTTYCWGWCWGREGLAKRDRSLINLAMIAVLNRHNELKVHVRGALNNGLSREEIREVLLQVGIYGATVGEVDGISLMSKAQLERMITEQHNQTELLQERPYHQAMGVLLNTPEAVYMGPNMRSFGHHGLGGSIGFGDPDAKLGFSYCCNQMHAVGTNGPRARRLIDALYASL